MYVCVWGGEFCTLCAKKCKENRKCQRGKTLLKLMEYSWNWQKEPGNPITYSDSEMGGRQGKGPMGLKCWLLFFLPAKSQIYLEFWGTFFSEKFPDIFGMLTDLKSTDKVFFRYIFSSDVSACTVLTWIEGDSGIALLIFYDYSF